VLARGRSVGKFYHRVPADTPASRDTFRLKTDEEYARVRAPRCLCAGRRLTVYGRR
jgi:hypothetical protein